METNQKLADLHSEHENWQMVINDYKEELKLLNERLGSVLTKFTARDVPPIAEHFQNQFILQRDVLDIMRHDFKQYENLIEDEQKKSEIASEDISRMREAYKVRLDDYRKIFGDLKKEYETFEKEEVVSA